MKELGNDMILWDATSWFFLCDFERELDVFFHPKSNIKLSTPRREGKDFTLDPVSLSTGTGISFPQETAGRSSQGSSSVCLLMDSLPGLN